MSVRILTTGGTIASAAGVGGAVSVAVGGGALVVGMAELPEPVSVRELVCRHSFSFTVADLLELVTQILDEAGRHDRVVVTHGTDTMEETAYLLDLLTPGDRQAPVVLTGAQRHAGEADSDGPRNLADAVQVAASPAARGLGPLVVMAGRIHAARQAVKVQTLAPDAFASYNGGPVGEVRRGVVRFWSRPIRPLGFALGDLQSLPRVDVVPSYVGADGVQLAACRAAGARGVVLEALGAGNPTPGLLEEVVATTAAGIPVLVTSRCASGPTAAIYGSGGGAALVQAGAVMAGPVPTSKARILLATALAASSLPRLHSHLV
ncbi:asparaginase [Kribbella sp. VKM Ac-2568]|uniref:asparaginase n=1 Tax=Kribbella sp. VKM Ac-2568 TaxID=2512219 RepID=UPI0010E8FA96|nr:asparaginase [Kribbella sp. VKM Ac-2568]TCM38660.1 L-asparaginase [Kribbella sp. VKM Ac-2568]